MACTITPGLSFDGNSARANAQASVFYSCSYLEASKYAADKYLAAVTANSTNQIIIAGLQTVVQSYFAQKQYETQKQAQDRLNKIADEQLRVSANLRTQYELSMDCERTQLQQACSDVAEPPNYDAIRLRVSAPIIAASTRRRLQASRSVSRHCAAAACALNDRVMVEEGRQLSRALESAYRREEALYEVRKARIRDFRSNVLQHMRGLATASSSSLAGAAATAQAAAGINPYAGWAAAANAAFGRISGILAQQTAGEAFSARMGMMSGGMPVGISGNGVAAQTNSGMTFDNVTDYINTAYPGDAYGSQAAPSELDFGFPSVNVNDNTNVPMQEYAMPDPNKGFEVARYDS